jgi:Zn-dependent protease with chaperone function
MNGTIQEQPEKTVMDEAKRIAKALRVGVPEIEIIDIPENDAEINIISGKISIPKSLLQSQRHWKAVLAHEMGHLSHRARSLGYFSFSLLIAVQPPIIAGNAIFETTNEPIPAAAAAIAAAIACSSLFLRALAAHAERMEFLADERAIAAGCDPNDLADTLLRLHGDERPKLLKRRLDALNILSERERIVS